MAVAVSALHVQTTVNFSASRNVFRLCGRQVVVDAERA